MMTDSRDATIAARRRAGERLEGIGADYGLTRERVRQICEIERAWPELDEAACFDAVEVMVAPPRISGLCRRCSRPTSNGGMQCSMCRYQRDPAYREVKARATDAYLRRRGVKPREQLPGGEERCTAVTLQGHRCKNWREADSDVCGAHGKLAKYPPAAEEQGGERS